MQYIIKTFNDMEKNDDYLTVSFRLKKELVGRLDKIALEKGAGYSRTTVLNQFIIDGLKKK